VSSFTPATGSLSGATLVTVTGTNFLNTHFLACSFGASTGAPATWITASILVCRSLPAASTGAVALSVANNAVDYVAGGGTFTYIGTQHSRDLFFWFFAASMNCSFVEFCVAINCAFALSVLCVSR